MKILVADDSPSARAFMGKILAAYGNCHFVEDGAKAVEAAASA